jgi:hypothetical protein
LEQRIPDTFKYKVPIESALNDSNTMFWVKEDDGASVVDRLDTSLKSTPKYSDVLNRVSGNNLNPTLFAVEPSGDKPQDGTFTSAVWANNEIETRFELD